MILFLEVAASRRISLDDIIDDGTVVVVNIFAFRDIGNNDKPSNDITTSEGYIPKRPTLSGFQISDAMLPV